MARISITTTPDGDFAAHHIDADGSLRPAFTATNPRQLAHMIKMWAAAPSRRAGNHIAIATDPADPVATQPPPERSYTNSRADQEGIATPSKWPAAALRHRTGGAA